MQTFKPSDSERPALQGIAAVLKEANERLAASKRAVEAAKQQLADWLKKNRGVDLDGLPIGEFVQIEDVVLVEVGKMTRFDEKSFQLAEPALYSHYLKPIAVKKFKPLLGA